MLRTVDLEVLGYDNEGEAFCPPCARSRFGEILPARCDVGLDDALLPLTRFTLWEDAIERGWQEAQERVDRFSASHPAFKLVPEARRVLVSDVALGIGREQCCECGSWITPSKGQERRAEAKYAEGREGRW